MTWQGPIADVDVHANIPALAALYPYLGDLWTSWIEERGWEGPVGVATAYPPKLRSTTSEVFRRPGVVPASSLEIVAEDLLDPTGTAAAVLCCYYGVDSLRHPDWAAALARAVNDWMAAEWLAKDDRLFGSIVVPSRDPDAAIKEIERVAVNRRFVQVLIPVRSDRLYGQRIWHRLWQTCADADLVVGIHWGGTPEEAPSTSGFPSWYAEEYAAETQAYVTQLVSLVAEGVLSSIPGLRLAFLEGGFTWVPWWGQRMNKEWRALRREIPWVRDLPFDLIRRHVRFSTAPIEAGPPAEMAKVLEWLGPTNLLMYSAGYPHGYEDDINALLNLVPDDARAAIMHDEANAWYGLDRR
jgi:predicted TIM-barrel fold metal-dependent hydrolase